MSLRIAWKPCDGVVSWSPASETFKPLRNWIACIVNELLRITLADAVAFLRERQLAYALVGGLAASVRGQTRVTADVDIVIDANVERALSVVTKLEQSPFQPLFAGVEEVVERSFILPLRHRAQRVKVDLALGLSGFEQTLIGRAEPMELAGCRVAVATAEDLIIMKALAGRPQDDQDLRGIVITQGARLDWEYCLKTAEELGEAIGQDLGGRVGELRRRWATG